MTRLKELQDAFEIKDEEANRLQKDFRETKKMLSHTQETQERDGKVHQNQCKDYVRQIDIVSYVPIVCIRIVPIIDSEFFLFSKIISPVIC